MAGGAGDGSVGGKSGVIVENLSEGGLGRVVIHLARNRTDSLVGELRAGERIRIIRGAKVADTGEHGRLLGCGH